MALTHPHQLDQAPAAAPASNAHISIELAPDGLHIRCEYIGSLASIPAAIARLEAAGLVDLVEKYRTALLTPAPSAGQRKPKADRVEPFYKPDGQACCPIHQRPLTEGRFGFYCSAKAKPGELANEKGYCALRFTE